MSGEDIKRELKCLRKKSGKRCDKTELLAKYRDMISGLPSFEARVLRAYYLEGKTHGQIAKDIYYSADTVRRILSRGIEMLVKK